MLQVRVTYTESEWPCVSLDDLNLVNANLLLAKVYLVPIEGSVVTPHKYDIEVANHVIVNELRSIAIQGPMCRGCPANTWGTGNS